MDVKESDDVITVLELISRKRLRKILRTLGTTGRRSDMLTIAGRGRYVKYRAPEGEVRDIAIVPTILAAAMRSRGRKKIRIKREDFKEKIRRKKTAGLICIVFDASSSMLGGWRAATAKSVVYDLLVDIYQKRDKVALIMIAGNEAKLMLQFTADIEKVRHIVESATYGGTTPLALGIEMGAELLKKRAQVERGSIPIMVVITDGEANVSAKGGDVMRELQIAMRSTTDTGIVGMVVEVGGGKNMRKIADECGWQYVAAESAVGGEEFVDLRLISNVLEAFAITAVNDNAGGILILGADKKHADAAVEACMEVGIELEAVKGCIYNCDPEGDNLCTECQIRKNHGLKIEKSIFPMPIVPLAEDTSLENVLGRIYVRYLALRGVLSRAHRGFVYLPTISKLSTKTRNIIKEVLREKKIRLQSTEGTVLECPCNIKLIALGHDINDIDDDLKDAFDIVINLGGEAPLLREIELLREVREFEKDPHAYSRTIERKIKETLLSTIIARERLADMLAKTDLSAEEVVEEAIQILEGYGLKIGKKEKEMITRTALSLLAMKRSKEEVNRSLSSLMYDVLTFRKGMISHPPDAVLQSTIVVMLLPLINKRLKGVVLCGVNEFAKKAINIIKNSGHQTMVSEGCQFNCNPMDVENLCLECRLKMEYGELSALVKPIPVVEVDSNIAEEDLFGTVYMKYVASPGAIANANSGLLVVHVGNKGMNNDVAMSLATTISEGLNVIEKDGAIIMHPAWFTLILTASRLSSVPSSLLRELPIMYDGRHVIKGVQSIDIDNIRNIIKNSATLMRGVVVPGDERDFVVRCVEHYGLENNGLELIVLETAKTLAAVRGRTVVGSDDVNDALALVLGKVVTGYETALEARKAAIEARSAAAATNGGHE